MLRSAFPRFVLCVALAASVLACGEPTREEKLAAALESRNDAQEAVDKAQAEVEETQAALAAAQKASRDASQQLSGAKQKLGEANAQVGLYATDDVLFRAVQKALLESSDLVDSAISARVQDGVVTLSGEAPDARVRDRAVEVARSVAGVSDVQSHIRIPAAAAKSAPAKASAARSDRHP